MVCSEVVNLPPEHLCPEVFTNELHYIQLILEAGRVPGQPRQSKHQHWLSRHVVTHVTYLLLHIQYVHACLPLNESLSHPEAHALKDRNTDSSVLKRRNSSSKRTNFIQVYCVLNSACVLVWRVL